MVTAMALTGATLTACSSGSARLADGATGLLANVEQSHQLTIAMSAYAPEDYQAPDGSWTGYDPVILSAFAKTLGAKLVINSIPFASSVQAVESHRDDITIDIYYTPQRAKQIAYSRPMLNYSDAVAVNASAPQVTSDTVQGLSGKATAVVIGSEEVTEAGKIPNAKVTQFDNIEDSFLALASGRVADDLQPDTDISYAKLTDPSLNVKLLGAVPASIAPSAASLRGYYGVPSGSYGQQFLQKLNSFLKKIACDGEEQQILNKFHMTEPLYLSGICDAANTPTG